MDTQPANSIDQKCAYVRADERCGMWAMRNGTYCFNHEPTVADAKRAAVTKGGSARYDRGLVPLEPIDLSEPTALLAVLGDALNRVRRVQPSGAMDVKTANSIGQLARVLIEAQREIALSERVTKLEKLLEGRTRGDY